MSRGSQKLIKMLEIKTQIFLLICDISISFSQKASSHSRSMTCGNSASPDAALNAVRGDENPALDQMFQNFSTSESGTRPNST